MRGKGEGSVFKDARGYWTGTIELPQHDGARRRKVIRRKNKSALLDEMRRLRTELERSGDLPTSTTTTEKWFAYWLDQIASKKVRPNTYDGYKRAVHNHIIPAIGKTRLEKLTGAHVRRVHDAVLAKGNNSTTALLVHRTMSVSFKAAVREGRISRNPATLVDPPRRAAPSTEALDLDEAFTVLRHATTRPDAALWWTVLLTGARRGEVIGLERDRVGDVLDLSWQLIRLPLTENEGKPVAPADYEYRHVTGGLYLTRPKSSKSWRVIPLIDPLRTVLQQHLDTTPADETGLVFLRQPARIKHPRPYSPDLLGKDWRALLTEAGITKDVRLHDGRHTTVDLLYEAGVPEDLITEIVGHSTRTMTQAYKTLRNRQRLTGAMEQFSALFEGLRDMPELSAPETRPRVGGPADTDEGTPKHLE